MLGGADGMYAGDGVNWGVFGCFALSSGSRKGHAYYGRGGTIDQIKSGYSGYQTFGLSGYRPIGYDCLGI